MAPVLAQHDDISPPSRLVAREVQPRLVGRRVGGTIDGQNVRLLFLLSAVHAVCERLHYSFKQTYSFTQDKRDGCYDRWHGLFYRNTTAHSGAGSGGMREGV